MKTGKVFEESYEDLWYCDYLDCIKKIIGISCNPEYDEYEGLFSILHDIEFTWSIGRDSNRAKDGMNLRRSFVIPPGYYVSPSRRREFDRYFRDHWCSVFEMLAALALRIDKEYLGDPGENNADIFFMEMIHNLGLDKYKSSWYLNEDQIRNDVQRWLDRRFCINGDWSPFPLKKAIADQRGIEIWDQMLCYVFEKTESIFSK